MFLRCSILFIIIFGISQIECNIFDIFLKYAKYYLKIADGVATVAVCPADQCTGKAKYGQQQFSVGGTGAYEPHYTGLYITFLDGSRGFCGGFLIESKGAHCEVNVPHVLTAAHCLENGSMVRIISGRYNYSDPNEKDFCDITVTKRDFKHHEFWTIDGFKNDIGIIRITNILDIACIAKYPHIRAIALPSSPEEYTLENTVVKMTGRGVRGLFYQEIQDVARCVTLPCLNEETCSKVMEDPENQFCAGCAKRAACSGDSGSAAISEGKALGIVSAGYNPCDIGLPTLFTEVAGFLEWIYAYMCKVD